MKTMPIGELKARFSDVLNEVRKGEEVVISYGKRRENVAVIVPYAAYEQKNRVRLGTLRDRASADFAEDFKTSSEELLGE